MRIAIIDDDQFQLILLSKLITTELSFLEVRNYQIDTFESGIQFLNQWQPESYDLILLDILMDRLTGIEVAHKIREADEHVRLAFCTSSNEFASESYEVNAQHYLLKPITGDSISKMFKRINFFHVEQARVFRLPDGHTLLLHDILYTEYCNHVVTFYLKDNSSYRLRISQAQTEAMLFPHGFFLSPYKGITVNLYAVTELTEDTLVLCNGVRLMITRRKLKEVKDAYHAFCLYQSKKPNEQPS